MSEKEKILTQPFDTLWREMWGEISSNQYKNEEQILKQY